MPKVRYPRVKKRYNEGAWVIFWRWKGKQYTISTGLTRKKEDEVFADVVQSQFVVALSREVPEFPEEYADRPGVQRYIADRMGYGTPGEGGEMFAARWLQDYEPHLMSAVVPSWGKPSLSMLKRLDIYTGGKIERTTPNQAQGFLDKLITVDGLKPARRNRALIMCNRFFKWAVRTKRTKENPFTGIRLMTEERAEEIVYCTKAERDAIIKLARETGDAEWLAVPVAFYAGLRREEIYRLMWDDIDFKARWITVRKTKTKKLRKIPLNKTLAALLRTAPAKQRQGTVAAVPPEAKSVVDRAVHFVEKLRRHAAKQGFKNPEKHIGWNVFRHTFGTLLAQEGVTIDTIASLMGNTPEVCRRHYINFLPKDKRFAVIDKL